MTKELKRQKLVKQFEKILKAYYGNMKEPWGNAFNELSQALADSIVLPEKKEEKGLNLSPEKSWFQGHNTYHDKLEKEWE